MTPFRIVHSFEAPPEQFWEVYVNPDYERERYVRTGVESWEEVDRREEDGVVEREIRGTPKRQLPGFVRKFAGNTLSFTEFLTYDYPNRRVDIRIVPGALSSFVEVVGTSEIEATDTGTMRTYEGSVTVRAPLVGGLLERFIIDDLTRSYEARTELMRTWLRRSGS